MCTCMLVLSSFGAVGTAAGRGPAVPFSAVPNKSNLKGGTPGILYGYGRVKVKKRKRAPGPG